MKSIRLISFWSMCGAALSLTGCTLPEVNVAGDHDNWRNFVIEFSAASGATEITVDSLDQGCADVLGAKKGCVFFKRKEDGTINFLLNKDQLGRTCDTAQKADWVITKIELSAWGDSATEKGNFGGRQPGWLKNAFTKVDRANGLIYENLDRATASNWVTIINLNNHSGGSVKDIYYQVTASNCEADPETIDIDPMVRNGGK